jgi:2-hydroxychromene-2-carboxylate isomerase
VTEPAWSDPGVPLVAIDLASVETYLLVRALSEAAVEEHGALWCPLASSPAPLDRDIGAARRLAQALQIPFVPPPRHPAPVPRAMRLAALAAARGRGAIFTVRATRLAWATGTDLDLLTEQVDGAHANEEEDLGGYLELIMREIGLDVAEAKRAAAEGSPWDLELQRTSARLAQLGIRSAPALRLHGKLHSGRAAISRALAVHER